MLVILTFCKQISAFAQSRKWLSLILLCSLFGCGANVYRAYSKSIEAYKALDDVSSEFDYKQWLSQFACEDMVECELFGQSEGKVAVNKGIQPVWENKKITLAAERVCYIHTPGSLGTGFRAGSKYIFTAAHIVRNLSSGSEDEFKKHDYYAVFDYLREQQLKKAPKFYFQAIVYKNQDLDTAVIELEETEETVLPPKFPKFDDIGKVMKKVKNDHTDIGVFLVGHNGALPMQLDVVKKYFRLGKRFKRAYNSLNAKCKESIDKDKKLRNLFDGRRCLFNCNFRHGGSGSPGVYYGESDTPVVVTFLQQGYPWWYYGEGCSKDKKNWKEDDCIQQGINFNAVYNDMKTENPDLCKDIFDQSFISFETE